MKQSEKKDDKEAIERNKKEIKESRDKKDKKEREAELIPGKENAPPRTASTSAAASTAQAQDENIYLRADKLFKDVAARATLPFDNTALENFAHSVEIELSKESSPELKAAEYLIRLQNEPVAFINGFSNKDTTPEQKALQANQLITEVIKNLIFGSSDDINDPLRGIFNEFNSVEGQRLLKEDLNERLGSGTEREINAALLLIQIRIAFSKESLETLRRIIKSGSKEAIRLPYPLCLIRKPCPR